MTRITPALCTAALALFLVLPAPGCDGGNGGTAPLGEEEQGVLDLLNYARTDPQGFARQYLESLYNSGQDHGAYQDLMARSPVGPLVAHDGLTEAARYHARDMAENCGLQHDSCDGTSWDVRIRRYYTGGAIAENAAMGYPTPEAVVIGWIVDENWDPPGHRINIMNGDYEHIGVGYYSSYWVTDFGAGGE